MINMEFEKSFSESINYLIFSKLTPEFLTKVNFQAQLHPLSCNIYNQKSGDIFNIKFKGGKKKKKNFNYGNFSRLL